MTDQRGGLILWAGAVVLGLFLILFVFFGACDAFFEDEDEPGDLGAPVEWIAR